MSPRPARFDPLDPEVLRDPYPRYRELRDQGPVCRGGPGTWMVTRYADVSALLAHPALVHRMPDGAGRDLPLFGTGPAGELSGRMLSALDGEEHTAVRRVVHAAVRDREPRPLVRETARRLLDEVGDDPFDVVTDLAFPLQQEVMARLLGLEPADRARVWPAAIELGRTFIPYRIPGREQIAGADDAVRALRVVLGGRLDERSGRDRSGLADLLDGFAAAVASGAVARETAVDNLVFLSFAGFETTMNVLGSVTALLDPRSGQWPVLAAHPELVPNAVEELLRFDSPAQYTIRLTSAPVNVGGQALRPGRMVLLMMGSANRDERRFDDPDRLDVRRDDVRHVAFGGGPHHCVGRSLGTAICQEALSALLDRHPRLERAGDPVRSLHPNFRAHASVPVVGA